MRINSVAKIHHQNTNRYKHKKGCPDGQPFILRKSANAYAKAFTCKASELLRLAALFL